MKKKEINVAVIGNGGRSCSVVGNLLRDSERNVHVVSVYDPDPAESRRCLEMWKTPDAKCCTSSLEAVRTPGVDWVMVFSPNAFHKQHILEGFSEGKNVFSEKPLATSIADCAEIFDAWKSSGVLFATGFVLRYAPLYRKTKEILDSGRLGKILSIDADEHIAPAHGGYIMCNWRRFTKFAGPHILEKCCHDLDLINWFCGSLPSRVSAFGGRDFFKPENRFLEGKYGIKTFHSWRDPHGTETPFTDDTDLMDNMVAVAEFRNNIRVAFSCTMSNAIPERRMRFCCTEGVLEVELYGGLLKYRNLGDEGVTVIKLAGDGHGGGDAYIMKELYECMCTGSTPKCGGSEGLESAVYALALDESARTGKVVDLEPVWKKLAR